MKRETKISAIVNWLAQGYTDKKIREGLKISESTYFYWKSKIENQGLNSVIIKKKPGPEPNKSIDPILRKDILKWRDKYGWGPGKISGHLRVHNNIHISHHQIYNLFTNTKRNKPLGYVRKIKGKTMYERLHSMSLLHTDWKDITTEPMLTYMDDHSRFILASEKFIEATMENTVKLLEFVVKKFGKPDQVLSDRGTQFWNNKGDSPTEFTNFCVDNDIEHIKCSKASPQANGKLESFHGCYDAESWRFKTHRKFVQYWNFKRPHGGIGYLYPSELFVKDRKTPTNSG